MRKLKKWAALGMAGILAAGCLAGCGDKKEEASGEGTAQEKTADKGEAVTLKWYLAGSRPPGRCSYSPECSEPIPEGQL